MLHRQVLTVALLLGSFLSIAQGQSSSTESSADGTDSGTSDPMPVATPTPPSPVQDPDPVNSNPEEPSPIQDTAPLSEKIIDEIVNQEEESPEDSYIDLNLLLGRRWFKDSPFRTDTLQLTTEWSLGELPIRAGPSVSFSKLLPNDNFFQSGQIIELGARVTAFWDTKWALPYLSIDYTLFSSGSLSGISRSDDATTDANLTVKTPGYSIQVGTSIYLGDFSLVIEAAIASSKNTDLDGIVSVVSEQDGQISIESIKAESIDNDRFQSIMMGFGLEI